MKAERTLAVQIPAELFERLKDYLAAHNLKQKQFLVQLIENALDEDTEAEWCGSSRSSGRCTSVWTMTMPVMPPASAWQRF